MRILIAEDDIASRRILEAFLSKWGHTPSVTANGDEAWQLMQADDAPCLLILDWMMPGMDGVTLTKKLRETFPDRPLYIILLTSKEGAMNVAEGLASGADDFIPKPFHPSELSARIQVGSRILTLQADLASRVHELETALASIKRLQGLLPICAYCKRVRDDSNYWKEVEEYVAEHSEAFFSHGICPDCYTHHIEPQLAKLAEERKQTTQA